MATTSTSRNGTASAASSSVRATRSICAAATGGRSRATSPSSWGRSRGCVGITSSFSEEQRERLLERLRPLVTPLEGHPWEHGFLVGGSPIGRLRGSAGRWTPEMVRDWVPLRPEVVCEVAYDQLDAGRFRHPARFLRWRPDRDPESCTTEQLAIDRVDAGTLLSS